MLKCWTNYFVYNPFIWATGITRCLLTCGQEWTTQYIPFISHAVFSLSKDCISLIVVHFDILFLTIYLRYVDCVLSAKDWLNLKMPQPSTLPIIPFIQSLFRISFYHTGTHPHPSSTLYQQLQATVASDASPCREHCQNLLQAWTMLILISLHQNVSPPPPLPPPSPSHRDYFPPHVSMHCKISSLLIHCIFLFNVAIRVCQAWTGMRTQMQRIHVQHTLLYSVPLWWVTNEDYEKNSLNIS